MAYDPHGSFLIVISQFMCKECFRFNFLISFTVFVLEEPRRLEIGFSCFSTFVITATVSSLGIPLPQATEGDQNGTVKVVLDSV